MKSTSVGHRLRAARQTSGLSLRELASRVGVSASMLSQLENGKSQASVTTLHALVTELDISLDQLFAPEETSPAGVGGAPAAQFGWPRGPQAATAQPVHHPGERPVLVMSGGVTWERLTTLLGEFVNAQLVEYPPGSASSADGQLTRHNGTEFAYLMEGELTLTLGYDTYQLQAGDSLAFDSTVPHLYANHGASVARGVWFEVGRQASEAPHPGAVASGEPVTQASDGVG